MDWTAMLLYIVVTCITPGPNNLMSLYLSANYGLAGARKYITASAASFFVKLLLCGALNVMLASVIPALIPYLKWLGAAYMLYLANGGIYLPTGYFAPVPEYQKLGVQSERVFRLCDRPFDRPVRHFAGGGGQHGVYALRNAVLGRVRQRVPPPVCRAPQGVQHRDGTVACVLRDYRFEVRRLK